MNYKGKIQCVMGSVDILESSRALTLMRRNFGEKETSTKVIHQFAFSTFVSHQKPAFQSETIIRTR